jgi:hypothetical protein
VSRSRSFAARPPFPGKRATWPAPGSVVTRLDVRDPVGSVASVHAIDRLVHHPGSSARRRPKKGGPDHAIGRSRGGLSTKIHAVVDQDGLPVRLLISPGQTSDMRAVLQLLEGLPTPATVVADRGYDSNAVLDLIARSGAGPAFRVARGVLCGEPSIRPFIASATSSSASSAN